MTQENNESPFIGQKIAGVRQLNIRELKREGWEWIRPHQTPVCIVLENGTILYPMQDEEGNGPGVLVGHDMQKDESFYCHLPKANA
jgi:hypothetical protein